MQIQQNLISRKHKHKYENSKDIYKFVRESVKVRGEWIKSKKKYSFKQAYSFPLPHLKIWGTFKEQKKSIFLSKRALSTPPTKNLGYV